MVSHLISCSPDTPYVFILEGSLPEEKGQPAEHEGAHYDAEGAGRFVLGPPALVLLPYGRAWNKGEFVSKSLPGGDKKWRGFEPRKSEVGRPWI